MNDEIQKEATVNAKPGEELSTEELSNINGGVVKTLDVSSAQLFLKCATGDKSKSHQATESHGFHPFVKYLRLCL